MLRYSPSDRSHRRSLQSFVVLLVCVALASVFCFHTIYGLHGLEVRSQLTQRSTSLSRDIRALEAAQTKLQRHIRLLRAPVHQDIIEEVAKSQLGFAYPDEKIIRR